VTQEILRLDGLDVHYGAIHALKGISLFVNEGEIVTLIGANGAGKTTTLRAVSGLVPPSAGAIKFRDAPITGIAPHEIVARGISHAPEGRGIFPELTVRENMLLGAYLRRDANGIAADLEKGFALFPRLREREQQTAGTLSGGEQQMLAIARALMSRPSVLLLDEPSLGLAPNLVETVFATIRDINAQGTSILLVEQNANMALHVAARGYVLETGRIVMEGTGKDLLASEAVRKAYLGE
jgi:branched-chain amino acid transport system ATP-binding protein